MPVGTGVIGEPVVATVVLVVVVVVEGVGGLIPSQSLEILTSAQFQNCVKKHKYLANEVKLITFDDLH